MSERGTSGNRFERTWDEWDDALDDGKDASELVSELPSEKILQLLAGAGNERRYERDILATEVENRLHKARRELNQAAGDVADLVHNVQKKGQEVREKVHETEGVVADLQGSEKLEAKTPQEITAHHGSALVENLMSMIERTGTALERLEEARARDQGRSLGREEHEDAEDDSGNGEEHEETKE